MSTPTETPNTLQLVHTLELDVNIFDTDCYGVMWHGAYTKWMEMGRVKLLENQGYRFSKPGEADGFIFPVVEQNLRFRRPAPYGDKLTLTTRVAVAGYKLLFLQSFRSHLSDEITLEATTAVVTVDNQWKLQRRMPEAVKAILGLAD